MLKRKKYVKKVHISRYLNRDFWCLKDIFQFKTYIFWKLVILKGEMHYSYVGTLNGVRGITSRFMRDAEYGVRQNVFLCECLKQDDLICESVLKRKWIFWNWFFKMIFKIIFQNHFSKSFWKTSLRRPANFLGWASRKSAKITQKSKSKLETWFFWKLQKITLRVWILIFSWFLLIFSMPSPEKFTGRRELTSIGRFI